MANGSELAHGQRRQNNSNQTMTNEAATRVIGRVALARSFRAGEVDCGIVARPAITPI
jgi:hypothetical protein